MLKRFLVGVSFLMLGAFGLQAQSSMQSGSQSGTQQQSGMQSSNSQLSDTDQQFARQAYQANQKEIKIGQLAEQKSSDSDVQKYAKQLVDDHTKANDQLQQIASSKGINLPSNTQGSMQNQSSNLSGASFDRQFARNQMRAHKQAISMFQNETQNGQDPDLKSYASNMLNALQEHEKMASDLLSRISTAQATSKNSQSENMPSNQSANNMSSSSSENSSSSSSTSATTNQASNNQSGSERLPRTASNMPLFGLFGFMLVCAALIVRSFRLLRNNR